MLKTLIEFGADVNASSGEGYPLEVISSKILALSEDGLKFDDLEKARDLLLQAHANPNLFNHSKLQRAAGRGDIAQVRSLIANGEASTSQPRIMMVQQFYSMWQCTVAWA